MGGLLLSLVCRWCAESSTLAVSRLAPLKLCDRSENGLHLVSRTLLHVRLNVGVGVHRHQGAGVAKALGNDPGMLALS